MRNWETVSVVVGCVLLLLTIPEAGQDASGKAPEGKIYLVSGRAINGEAVELEFKGPIWPRIRWDYGDGKMEAGGRKTNHVYAQPGIYEVVVSDASSGVGSQIREKIPVLPDDRSVRVNQEVIAAGAEIRVTALKFLHSSIRWDFGDGEPPHNGGAEVVHVYRQPGVYAIRAIDLNGSGFRTFEAVIRVVPDTRAIQAPERILQGEPVEFSLQGASGGQFTWDFSGASSGNGIKPAFVLFKSVGPVVITVRDLTGFYGPKQLQVMVSPDNRRIMSDQTDPTVIDDIVLTVENTLSKKVRWVFEGGGTEENAPTTIRHRFDKVGRYRITVFDLEGRSAIPLSMYVSVGELSRDFQIKKLEFVFQNGKSGLVTPFKNPVPHYRLRVQADGRGLLRGRWLLDGTVVGLFSMAPTQREICEPQPGQYVDLPANIPGLHRFTCDFLNYSTPFEIPILSYFVTETGFLRLLHPETDAVLPSAESVRLQWEVASWSRQIRGLPAPGEHFEVAVSPIPFLFLPDGRANWIPTGEKSHYDWPCAGFKGWLYWQIRLVKAGGVVVTVSETGAFSIRDSNERP